MPKFLVTGVPRGATQPTEPTTAIIEAPSSDDARMKGASRGMKVTGVRELPDATEGVGPVVQAATVVKPRSAPAEAPIEPAPVQSARPQRAPAVPAEQLALAGYVARYMCWLGLILLLYGGLIAYFAVRMVDRRAFWIDVVLRTALVCVIYTAPAITCFVLAALVRTARMWALIANLVVASIGGLLLLLVAILSLFGMPVSLVSLLIAFIPLVLAIGVVFYAAKALRARATDPRRAPRGFDVNPRQSPPGPLSSPP